ncbi:recombinase family protein [Paenibacillus sp. 1P07SE]|uniref:recombinase family protein n=1 Tax=Paenibacillus sp. 1P07SE TaxID=3132209 RepID=UPI0039A6716C
MKIGYMRPYQDDVHCQVQLSQLQAHDCNSILQEEHSSPKKRVVLKKVLHMLGPGDTLVVAKLFSLADSTRHLAELLHHLHSKQAFFHSITEGIDTSCQAKDTFEANVQHLLNFQSDVISENTKKGMYEAKQKGMHLGRPRKPDENIKRAISMYQSQQYNLAQIKEETGISKTTLYRYLEN